MVDQNGTFSDMSFLKTSTSMDEAQKSFNDKLKDPQSKVIKDRMLMYFFYLYIYKHIHIYLLIFLTLIYLILNNYMFNVYSWKVHTGHTGQQDFGGQNQRAGAAGDSRYRERVLEDLAGGRADQTRKRGGRRSHHHQGTL